MGLKSSWLKSLGLRSPGLKLEVEKFVESPVTAETYSTIEGWLLRKG
jgi:hypothetical protein